MWWIPTRTTTTVSTPRASCHMYYARFKGVISKKGNAQSDPWRPRPSRNGEGDGPTKEYTACCWCCVTHPSVHRARKKYAIKTWIFHPKPQPQECWARARPPSPRGLPPAARRPSRTEGKCCPRGRRYWGITDPVSGRDVCGWMRSGSKYIEKTRGGGIVLVLVDFSPGF